MQIARFIAVPVVAVFDRKIGKRIYPAYMIKVIAGFNVERHCVLKCFKADVELCPFYICPFVFRLFGPDPKESGN